MTSSNGNIFRVIGPLYGEFAGHWRIPHTEASDAELCCFFICALNKRLRKQSWSWRFETPSRSLSRHYNVTNPTMQLSHIPQHTIQNRNVHISVLNGVLWDMGQLHCGICEICLWGSLPTRSPQFQFLRKKWPSVGSNVVTYIALLYPKTLAQCCALFCFVLLCCGTDGFIRISHCFFPALGNIVRLFQWQWRNTGMRVNKTSQVFYWSL